MKTDRWASGLADFVTRRRWLVIGLTLLVVAAAAGGVRFLEFSNNYRVFFSPDNPELVAFESFQDTYTKNDNIMFVLQPESGDVFTPPLAEALEKLAVVCLAFHLRALSRESLALDCRRSRF